eukprot:CAMPEP_0113629884 /NCGR_PEP_ID=MMETSP0017_2-20120614/15519_1 /TAXON_ID=2856 /ORGANISM="Cylindrotheca closterium" /LENGTH=450 /DNA_ID=CAMNT_0000540311 /DNA_START=1 /DNA_END=1353 /DNA_ORIENTATION=- /assembly_acc=CAM_ASM_000147
MNEDPNDPRRPIGGLGGKDVGPWNSPGGDATCASSVQSGDDDQNQEEHEHVEVTEIVPINQERDLLQRQMIQWGIASGTSVAAVTVAFVPIQIIMAFFITMSVFMGFSFTVFQRLRLEAMDLQRRGIAGYLPQGIVDTLVNTSFHDHIVNGNFFEENGFFLLYFIPGLSEEQINAYVDRLVPRHQHVLRRPGLGHFAGPGFMRLLLGEQRYAEQVEQLPQEQQQQDGRPVPRRLELASGEVASHLGDDDIPHIEEVVEEEAAAEEHQEDATHATQTTISDFSRFWGTPQPIGRVFSWTEEPAAGSNASAQARSANIPLNPDGSEEVDELAIDAEVIRDAITGGINSITNGVYEAVSDTAIGFFTGTPLRTGLTVTAATVGVGYFSMWLGGGVSSDRMRMPRSSMPSNPAIYSSFLASGATAGIMYFFQIGRSAGGPGSNPGSGSGSSSGP